MNAPPPSRDITALWQEFRDTHEELERGFKLGDLKSAERAILRQRALIERLRKLIDESA